MYFIPGMVHCAGGTGPDDGPDQLLQALIDWVEKRKDPKQVVTHRGPDRAELLFADHVIRGAETIGLTNRVDDAEGGLESRDIAVCPYPQVAVFDNAKANIPGAVYEAAHWSCSRSRE